MKYVIEVSDKVRYVYAVTSEVWEMRPSETTEDIDKAYRFDSRTEAAEWASGHIPGVYPVAIRQVNK